MIEMYTWLVVAVVVAVGVLALAGLVAPGDPDVDRSERSLSSAWLSLWRDFLAGTATVRSQLSGLRRRSDAPADTPTQRVSVLPRSQSQPRARSGHVTKAAAQTPSTRPPEPAAEASGDSRFEASPATTTMSFDEFFEATATTEPAYLDATELGDTLNSLRR